MTSFDLPASESHNITSSPSSKARRAKRPKPSPELHSWTVATSSNSGQSLESSCVMPCTVVAARDTLEKAGRAAPSRPATLHLFAAPAAPLRICRRRMRGTSAAEPRQRATAAAAEAEAEWEAASRAGIRFDQPSADESESAPATPGGECTAFPKEGGSAQAEALGPAMLLTGPAARAIAIPIVENKMPLAPGCSSDGGRSAVT
mmetsp:Transcript_106664/g.300249  ORF Transcript_106664/g.300249 Transcript_106664/m.300249 type:complete len:204 (-) Transcript_106664:3-614(-)